MSYIKELRELAALSPTDINPKCARALHPMACVDLTDPRGGCLWCKELDDLRIVEATKEFISEMSTAGDTAEQAIIAVAHAARCQKILIVWSRKREVDP